MKNINVKGYIFSEEICESMILNMFLRKLYKKYPNVKLRIISDNGKQFDSNDLKISILC